MCINYVNSLDTKWKLENDAEAFSEKRLELPSVPFCLPGWFMVQQNAPLYTELFDIIYTIIVLC